MNIKKMTKMSKIFLVAQAIFILGVFFLVIFLSPNASYPRDNTIVGYNIINFDFDNAEFILIDDNSDFTSPIKFDLKEQNTTKILLEPGTYYWKSVGILESTVRKFTIGSEVGLELKNQSLKNTGNILLNITEETEGDVSGLFILEVDVEYIVNETDNKKNYRGEQHEN